MERFVSVFVILSSKNMKGLTLKHHNHIVRSNNNINTIICTEIPCSSLRKTSTEFYFINGNRYKSINISPSLRTLCLLKLNYKVLTDVFANKN